MKKRKSRIGDENGMIVVEGVLVFTVFLMVIIAIIYLTNIFIVHNKIQFAINSAAHEMASYSYLYQALGVRGADQTIEADGSPYTKPMDETAASVIKTIEKMQTFSADGQQLAESVEQFEISKDSIAKVYEQAEKTKTDAAAAGSSIKASVSNIKELCSDPKSLLLGIFYMGASGASYEVKSAGAQAAAEALVKKYIGDEKRDADTWLTAYGVKNGSKGLAFGGSTMFCDSKKQLIDIIVQYDIDLKFIGLVLPKDTVHIVQRVTVPAWMNGDDRSFE